MYVYKNYVIYYVNGVRIFEHKLNALLHHSLHDVFTKHVHHKNRCPLDNSPSNLQLLSNSEHRRLHNLEYTEQDKLKISQGLKGHPVSPELITKLKEVNIGNTNAQKDYPTIIKNGISPKGNQVWSIHYHNKVYVSSIDKELLSKVIQEGSWKQEGFTLRGVSPRKRNEYPTITKTRLNGKCYYRVYYHGKTLKTSKFKGKLVEFIESGEWKTKYHAMCGSTP